MIKYTVKFWEYDEVIHAVSVSAQVVPQINEVIKFEDISGRVTDISHVIKKDKLSASVTIVIDADVVFTSN